ncbi:hypothetical protein FK513_30300, partial [Klebsiella pneumoniae]|nr:hypothetical protein [Klebsiella pneumoniae]
MKIDVFASAYWPNCWRGEPSVSELKNPERNISMGAAYLSILENGPLAGIKDPQVMRYALRRQRPAGERERL